MHITVFIPFFLTIEEVEMFRTKVILKKRVWHEDFYLDNKNNSPNQSIITIVPIYTSPGTK